MGLLFTRPTLALFAATISKMASKVAPLPPTDSAGVVIPNTGALIEYDTVALELVLMAH